ncbi:MAG: helix-turn-helix transcriptional regulator [Clostridia bacterium]|jgi:transcriptional regulator with XRE-family HTH domain|nr:helix-turn-helix transcriptional regulator [Clostridia bacterium]
MKNYGEILKEHRLLMGKTLMDVERETGISNSNLSRWEQGKVLPSVAFCEMLADYYGISLDELIGRDIWEK